MNRYILISLIIHAMFLLPQATLISEEDQQSDANQSTSDSSGQYDVQVIEKVEGDGPAIEVTDFYWGVGINTTLFISPETHDWAIQINEVYNGYSAQDAGLAVDDIIILINGASPGQNNDIKGDGPGRLYLTILRKGVRIEKIIDRVKVYY